VPAQAFDAGVGGLGEERNSSIDASAGFYAFNAQFASICQLDLNFVPFRQHPADDGEDVLKSCLAKKSPSWPIAWWQTLGRDGDLSQFIHWMNNVDIPDIAAAQKLVHWACLSVTW